ncbi:endonuclease I [Thiohalobacter thiocyanaticus]|uniref:Endonuclease I n=1 Tax=Thiohalobacter thiocyanaticus TaxID=585455 RepID=A0A1Z4VQZ7_9GAMM|nr:endonuclease [Thiohalobacter thiocyanaticus]BAZ93758.1 endonuclease I [Thiohalobacter thiocyanaticus]
MGFSGKQAWIGIFISLLITPLAYAEQTVIDSYRQAREIWFWDQLYPRGGETLYCGQAFRGHAPLNIEHVYAASWAAEAMGCSSRSACRNDPDEGETFNHFEADLHNLFPTLGGVNSARGNLPFGRVPGEELHLLACDFEVDRDINLVEPRTEVRGDIARAIFYVHDAYDLPIPFEMKEMLVEWHRNDPPSTHEIWRNDTIARLQGTRNPYIDSPELADELEGP